MSANIAYLELKYGKIKAIDVHGLTKEEARAEIIYAIESSDIFIKALLVTHGYHSGVVLKKFLRKEFSHNNVCEIVNVDASRTLLVLNFEKNIKEYKWTKKIGKRW